MLLKRSGYGLCMITGFLLGVYGLYILFPGNPYFGYNLIGIVQLVLVAGTLASFVFSLKNIKVLSQNKVIVYSLLLIWHVLLLLFMAFSLFVWFAFRPA